MLGTAALTIDYSSGVTKTVSSLPLNEEGGLWATLAIGLVAAPGVAISFDQGLTDRGGTHHTHIVAIDGVSEVCDATLWTVRVNGKPVGSSISYHVPGLPGSPMEHPTVNDGDHVLLKLERPET